MAGIDTRPVSTLGGSIPESGRLDFRPRNRSSTAAARGKKDDPEAKETQNQRAIEVLARVKEKLTGRDFKTDEDLDIEAQVSKLIAQATSLENLCQHYIGWCSFW
jgi:FKBP12-rapamycin complex-associated protein